jgi:hypothetical protein
VPNPNQAYGLGYGGQVPAFGSAAC